MKAHFLAAPVLLVAVFAQGVFGQPAETRPDPSVRHARMLTRMLNLSTDQQTQVEGILSSARSELTPIETQLRTFRTNLIAAIKNNDAGGINAITQQMAGPRQQADAIRATAAGKIYALLTPDQQAKVNNGIEMLSGLRGMGGFGGMRRGGAPTK